MIFGEGSLRPFIFKNFTLFPGVTAVCIKIKSLDEFFETISFFF